MTDKKRIIVNILATITVICVQAGVGFFLSPFIVRTLGVEAQGFVQLASNFASYVAMITLAINSMSSRFITIEIERGNNTSAGQYYTSVFWGNIALFAALSVPLALCIGFLDKIINIPQSLKFDVKVLFMLVVLNLFISNALSVWNNTFYIVNRLYLQSICSIATNILNITVTVLLFSFFMPRVWYSTVAASFSAIMTISWAAYNKCKYLPELKISKKLFSLKKLLKIISSGIWRTLQSLGEALLTGLDLLICNLMLDTQIMGVLALSKTMSTVVQTLNWQIAYTFAPTLAVLYAKNDKQKLLFEIKRACKINAIIGTIPIMGLVIFGREFFALWLPSQNAVLLQTLSILGCFWIAATAGIQPLGNVFAVANKPKPQAISVIISGVINTIVVLICLKTTALGVYAIAGTSTVIGLIRNIAYTCPAAARYLGFKWHTFYCGFGYSLIGTAIVSAVAFVIKRTITPDNWLELFSSFAITGVVGLFANTLFVFNKGERRIIITAIVSAAKKIGKNG